jgi:hypothetical protein
MRRERAIFVLDVLDKADFAFEADNLAQAEEYAQAPWLLRSVGQFFSQHGRGCDGTFTHRTRPATEAETSTYRALADEFSDTSDCFFVAYLG